MRPLFAALVLAPALLLASLPTATAQNEARGLNLTSQTPTRYYALVIGNNAYTSLPKLKTAEADAREVERLLRESYSFQTKLLINATRGQIVSALSGYRRELNADANLLIYYAGHSYNDKETEKTYWLPVDAERDDSSNWIIADEITSGIRAIPARHVLVVSDSCYSGTLTRGLGEMLPRPAEREQFLQRMAAGRSRTLMASGGDEPVADNGGGGHSIFADALLRGLREMDKGQFTAAELFRNYVEEAVAGRANQVPEYNPLRNSGHEAGDFVFVKVKVGDKTVEVTVSAPPAARVDPAQQELAFWSSMQNSVDAEDFKDYLARYPNGLYAGLARRRLDALSKPVRPDTSAPPASNATSNTTSAALLGVTLVRRVAPSPVHATSNTTSAARPGGRPQQMQSRAGIEFVWVPPGSSMMGSEQYGSENPAHQVTISEGFYMGKYEVTQAEWQKVMRNNPSDFKGKNLPVEQVSWDDAVAFVARLNAQNDSYMYRLPTEAEWEYACRAGTTGDYAGDLNALAWYGANSGSKTHAVGSKQPNAFGLFDMHGNVWEWVQDYYHESYDGAPTDGSARLSGGDSNSRVLRGGSWDSDAFDLRSAHRLRVTPDVRGNDYGFRVVAVARAS